jgi:hypothetical protein
MNIWFVKRQKTQRYICFIISCIGHSMEFDGPATPSTINGFAEGMPLGSSTRNTLQVIPVVAVPSARAIRETNICFILGLAVSSKSGDELVFPERVSCRLHSQALAELVSPLYENSYWNG